MHVVPACCTTMSHDGHMIITPLMAISSHRCKFSKKKVGLVCIFLLADSPSILFFWCVPLPQHKKWEGDGKYDRHAAPSVCLSFHSAALTCHPAA